MEKRNRMEKRNKRGQFVLQRRDTYLIIQCIGCYLKLFYMLTGCNDLIRNI